ncbi:MAG: metallophosphoesterase [Betaproteobacteria bacterium]
MRRHSDAVFQCQPTMSMSRAPEGVVRNGVGFPCRKATRPPLVLLVSFAMLAACVLGVALVGHCAGLPGLPGLPGLSQGGLTFAVVGDSQGRTPVWERIVDALNATRPAFVLHCGDMVASGTREQYEDFLKQAERLRMPWHAVPGNHDVRGDGAKLFTEFTGKDRYYSFVEKGYRFIGLDSSAAALDAKQVAWLERELTQSGPKFVFMHVPLFDPRPGGDHSFLDTEQARRLRQLFREHEVLVVFSGHVHLFSSRTLDGVTYVTTGGAGAPLYAPRAEGGFYHYTLVRVDGNRVSVEAKQVAVKMEEPVVKVVGPKGEKEFTLGDLALLPSVEATSAFENQFGNVSGGGTYKGVLMATLLDQVGGVRPGQTLVVRCSDGYSQEFGYENVHVSKDWAKVQGPMVLAYEKDGKMPPEWGEGPRLIFAPPDGVYGNDDCRLTSLPGQGWNVYKSAGGRWARNVSVIEVR